MFPVILLGLLLVAESDEVSSRTHKSKLSEMKRPKMKWNSREIEKGNATDALDEVTSSGHLIMPFETSNDDPPYPAEKIAQIKAQLSNFKDAATAKIRTQLERFDAVSQWDDMSTADRVTISLAVTAVAGNLDKLANAKDDPIGALQGTINILGGFAAMTGPQGQVASIVLGFVSSFLGLFGNTKQEKSLDQIVREQIDDALKAFGDKLLLDEAAGVVTAFQVSKAFLDPLTQSNDDLSDVTLNAINCNVPITQHVDFMGTLESQIRTLFDATDPLDAKKCIKYIELYAKIAVMKDALVGQTAALIPNSEKVLQTSVLAVQQSLRQSTKALFQFLYNSDPNQKVLPYYDVDLSVVTDSYAIQVLGIADYDRSLKGERRLRYTYSHVSYYLDWKTGLYPVHALGSKALGTRSNKDTGPIWKLRPHGNNLFSIVNRRGCSDKPPSEWCDAFLSWEEVKGDVLVKLSTDKPVIWQIQKAGDKGRLQIIRNKWGCSSGDARCDMILYVTKVSYMIAFRPPVSAEKFVAAITTTSPGHGFYWSVQ